jgi:hypothetical protein
VKAPIPKNEVERLAALKSYDVLDTPPELAYDELTELAARLCGCPPAFISLMDESRQWFKSTCGFPPEHTEIPRDDSVCATTICQNDLLVVPDLAADERFRHLSFVSGEPHLRFYCGMPLINSEGYALGTICGMGFEARDLDFTAGENLRTRPSAANPTLCCSIFCLRPLRASCGKPAPSKRVTTLPLRSCSRISRISPGLLPTWSRQGWCKRSTSSSPPSMRSLPSTAWRS